MNRIKSISLALSMVSSFAIGFVQPLMSVAADAPKTPAVPASAQAAVETGKSVSDFTLPGADGKKHSLSDYKGKTVVLEWVNFGCPFVRKHYDSKNMQGLQKDYTGKGVVWLSICSSAPKKQGHMTGEELTKKLETEGWKGTAYLIDEDGKVGREFGAKNTPAMFILDKKHALVYSGAIDSIESTEASDIPKAQNYVKAALDEELSGKKIATTSTKPYGCSVKYAN